MIYLVLWLFSLSSFREPQTWRGVWRKKQLNLLHNFWLLTDEEHCFCDRRSVHKSVFSKPSIYCPRGRFFERRRQIQLHGGAWNSGLTSGEEPCHWFLFHFILLCNTHSVSLCVFHRWATYNSKCNSDSGVRSGDCCCSSGISHQNICPY